MKMMKLAGIADEEKIDELKNKTVAIVGLGGVGSTVAEQLARNNINLRIVDKERVYEEEVPRQTLYTREDIGKFKAKQAKKRLEEITRNVKIKTFHEELHEDNLFLLGADVIIDASNNMKTALLVNRYALENKTPLITVNYAGTKGHLLVVDKKQHKKGPCIKCLEKNFDLGKLKKTGIYSPTTTLLAGLAANAALKNLLNIENEETLLKVDAYKTEIRHTHVEKQKGCDDCKGK
ncbi:MAG: HesA/MoeB/ThiF family protein [Candidatus Woesearchaeota archaeon]